MHLVGCIIRYLATLLDGHFDKNRGLTTAQTMILLFPSISVASVNHKFKCLCRRPQPTPHPPDRHVPLLRYDPSTDNLYFNFHVLIFYYASINGMVNRTI
jgi:hypothetical protein